VKIKNRIDRQIKRIKTKVIRLETLSRKYSWIRLIIAIVGIVSVLAALYYKSDLLSWLAFILFFITFVVMAIFHLRIKRKISLLNLFVDIKQTHLDRIGLKWPLLPLKNITAPINHPFANDLNISGEFSLFRLLNNTSTSIGADYLLNWLCDENPQYEEVIERQNLIKELAPLFRFRDKLTFYARCNGSDEFDGKRLLNQISNTVNNKIPFLQFGALILLALINIILFAGFYFYSIPALFSLFLIAYLALFFMNGKYIKNLLNDASDLSDGFKKIEKTLTFIEDFNFRSNTIKYLCDPVKKNSPKAAMKRMNILLTLIGLRSNPVLQIAINVIFPVDYLLNFLFTKHTALLLKQLPQWLDVWHKLDGLSALANFSQLHQDYTFPQIEKNKDSDKNDNILDVKKMGHPLINESGRIDNNFSLSVGNEIALITGSNMSGKSTFLRTVGINIVLAYAGGAVCASHFRVKMLKLLSCINISDSLGEGISYFYAEVKRLKLIIEQQKSVFFLIDEIYRGTNNRERLIGSRAIISKLASKHNVGIISTHDLELTTMEKEISTLHNYHFRDMVADGKMSFDYKLHEGPCPTTNALKIMKAEGLPIE
jgi:hypothetical protein